ncbi:MAG: TonB-dependent receptor domain-containing protein [Vibrio sp.]
MKNITIATGLSLVASSVLLSFPSYAQQDSANTETMLVTATQRTELITNLITPVIELTKEDIDKTQANTITEALRQLPGVQIKTNGGDSSVTKVFVRGSSNVVVLFNGMRLGSATTGTADLSQIPLAGVQKIEYLRGSRAAVYGADATAGVINIVTGGGNTETTGSVKATGGSDGYQSYTGSVAMVPSDKSWVNVTTQYQSADNYDVRDGYDDDKDGYENTNVIADWGVHLDDKWIIRMNGYYHNGMTEYDASEDYNDRNPSENYSINGQLIYTTDAFTSNFSYGYSQDELESRTLDYMDPSKKSHTNFTTQRDEINWRNNWQFTDLDSVGFGYEYTNDDVGDSDLGGEFPHYEETERYNHAGYINLAHNGDVIQLEGSIRYDDNEQFGDKTTWQLGAGWQFAEQFRLTGNVGTGFKVPTFNDLYYPGYTFLGQYYPGANPDLDAEESTNYEMALEGEHSFLSWRLAAFYNDVDNRIILDDSGIGHNLDNADMEIRGVEWVGEFYTGPLYHQISLQYLKPEDKDTGDDVVNIARQQYKWQVGYQGDNWDANITYRYQSHSYDGSKKYGTWTKLDAYSMVDLAASYDLTPNWILSARISNLFDEDYEVVNDYNEPERSFYGSVEYKF